MPCEESPSWPIEALKAQAVAARSYAYRTRNTDQSISAIDTKADVANQTYCPIEREGTASASAVAATSREIVTYQGSVAATFYSASSGGRTSSMQASWGSSFGYPYLVPVTDRYDGAGGANPNHTWKPVVYGPIELARKFGLNGSVSAVDQTIDAAVAARDVAGDPPQGLRAADAHVGPGLLGPRPALDLLPAAGRDADRRRASVVKGRNFTITGRVWPRPTTKVLLQYHADGVSSWTTAGTPLKVAANGTFSVVRHQSVPHSFRVVRNSAVSPVVRVGIHAAKMAPPSSVLRSWA